MSRERELAEVLALQALAWLVGHDDLLPLFLGATGATPQDLRARTGDPALLIAVLDFLMTEDAWLIAFCDASGQSYEAPERARQLLPGGARVHWT